MIVFDRENTLALAYTHTSAKRKKYVQFALKAVLVCTALAVLLSNCRAQVRSDQKRTARQPNTLSGKETFLRYCASCHGVDAKGNGPAAIALKPPPSDLTTISKRNDGKFPSGYVGALLKFGKNLVAHGSNDMPAWGPHFKDLDPIKDPTGQHHVDDLVAYIDSLQVK
jgi:mono/diheme cytochrome c family protein